MTVTMGSRADHLHALLEHLDLHGSVLVGGSMGGNTIGSYVAARGTARLAGVVNADQTPTMVNSADWPHGFYGCTRPPARGSSTTASRARGTAPRCGAAACAWSGC
jgi:pimeloyl-ACP methyl ester carboxylesterase